MTAAIAAGEIRRSIAVPDAIAPNTEEWDGVIARLALAHKTTAADTDFRVRHEHIDVTNLRAANDVLIVGSIPLSAGRNMIESGFAMLRAAATTARGPKAHISGGYSKLADATVAEARMGHTVDGSYIIPILMPIPEMEAEPASDPPMEGMGAELIRREPIERRTTRTFAQALNAVYTHVVEPAVPPKADRVLPLTTAGVSREFVIALQNIVRDEAVTTFETSFAWAGAIPAPTDVAQSIEIPSEASELLGEMARHLKSSRREPVQSITGPIVDWHHVPEEPTGWIGVQSIRNGRDVIVRVHLPAEEVERAIGYMHGSRTVVVQGRPVGGRGKPVEIFAPATVVPLADTMLPVGG